MRVAGVERSRGYNGRRWGQSVQGFVDRGRTWASVLFFFFFLAVPRGLQNLSSPTRD